MKPQQKNTDVRGESHVFVQKPDGEQINVEAKHQPDLEEKKEEEVDQTGKNTRTKSSHEVSDGEDEEGTEEYLNNGRSKSEARNK